FDGSQPGPAADLGRCAAWVEKGDRERALSACLSALEKDPKNRTALANRKWLAGGENGNVKP
ncbi:MAG TPA: hypothetical protein PL037_04650, partial [Elusimicrobiales bacterium]|nr:hypothetical protein [Elusimicrobiales bacterium]